MPGTLTAEQVLALAPDASAAKAGRGLANPRPWTGLGQAEAVVWGLCQGSGAQPYQVQADLGASAFKCSCPSQKHPCKHSLGLLFLLADQPTTFSPGEPPAWVAEWLAGRAKRAEQRTARVERAATEPADPAATAAAAATVAKTAARREARAAAGLDDLEQWLADIARRGLAGLPAESGRFWERPAARLVDAQAPGLAREVRELAGIPASGEGWQARLLARLGRLQLAIEGYRRLETLPPTTQADLRTWIGWTVREEEVLAGPAVRDRWQVLGVRTEQEDKLRSRWTWLAGATSGRTALLLQFAFGREPFAVMLPPGLTIEAELAFYPGGDPTRALVRGQPGSASPMDRLPGQATLTAATAAYVAALAANPWLATYPLAVGGVVPTVADGRWLVRDREDRTLPLLPRPETVWPLLALSGGRPVDLFGEWDGEHLRALTVWTEAGAVGLEQP